MKTKTDKEEFDVEDLRAYGRLSAQEKLEYLERMNRFLQRVTPEKAKKLAQKLKTEGF